MVGVSGHQGDSEIGKKKLAKNVEDCFESFDPYLSDVLKLSDMIDMSLRVAVTYITTNRLPLLST